MSEPTPWLLFDPEGEWDGLMWSPETEDEAGKKFFHRMPSWRKKQREGWTIRRGEPGEHKRLLALRLEATS